MCKKCIYVTKLDWLDFNKNKTMETKTYPIKNAHSLHLENINDMLQTNLSTGLSESDIVNRIKTYGLNRYEEQKQKSIFLLLFEQDRKSVV